MSRKSTGKTRKHTKRKISPRVLRIKTLMLKENVTGAAVGRSVDPPVTPQMASQVLRLIKRSKDNRVENAFADALGVPVGQIFPPPN